MVNPVVKGVAAALIAFETLTFGGGCQKAAAPIPENPMGGALKVGKDPLEVPPAKQAEPRPIKISAVEMQTLDFTIREHLAQLLNENHLKFKAVGENRAGTSDERALLETKLCNALGLPRETKLKFSVESFGDWQVHVKNDKGQYIAEFEFRDGQTNFSPEHLQTNNYIVMVESLKEAGCKFIPKDGSVDGVITSQTSSR
jgi:hypothetical protein